MQRRTGKTNNVTGLEEEEDDNESNEGNEVKNNSTKWRKKVVILSVSVFVLCVVAAVFIAFSVESNKWAEQQIMTTLLEYFPYLSASNDQQQALTWILADRTSLRVFKEKGMSHNNKKRIVLERFVLATVYFATNGPSWRNDGPSWRNVYPWLSELSVCQWDGVECQQGDATTEQGEVSGLHLYANHLIGSIPTGVGLMTSMTKLELWDNALTGSIPTEIGMMTSMVDLRLSSNHLFGSIPTELGSLTRLYLLAINSNNLTGSIPTEIGRMTSMTRLFLRFNNLTGSIPTELGSLRRLSKLFISNNPNLTGTIPSEVVAILPYLNSCYMGGTNLIDIPQKCQGV